MDNIKYKILSQIGAIILFFLQQCNECALVVDTHMAPHRHTCDVVVNGVKHRANVHVKMQSTQFNKKKN